MAHILTEDDFAGVVELVDAPDSKSGVRKDVSVRVRPPAPFISYKQLALKFKY